jgi:hypothetical protein
VLFELMKAVWVGFQVSEIEWRLIDTGRFAGRWGLAQIAAKPAKQIGFDLDESTLAVRAFKPYTPLGGYGPPVPIEKALLYTYGPDRGLPYGTGDGRACYKHWFGLDGILKFWLICLERFGGGFFVAQYPAGNPQAQEDAQAALDEIRQGTAAVLPDNVTYTLEQASQGMFAGFKEAADWHKQEILYTRAGVAGHVRGVQGGGRLAQAGDRAADSGLHALDGRGAARHAGARRGPRGYAADRRRRRPARSGERHKHAAHPSRHSL